MLMLDQIVANREQQPVDESIKARTIAACQQGDRDALRPEPAHRPRRALRPPVAHGVVSGRR